MSAAAHLILRIGKHVDKQGMSKIDAQDLSCCKKCIRVHFAGSVTRNRRSKYKWHALTHRKRHLISGGEC